MYRLPRLKRRQRGAIALVQLGAGVVIIGLLIVMAASFSVAFLARGRTRIILVSLVASGWLFLAWKYLFLPQWNTNWRVVGYGKCQLEAKALPESIQADSFLDEGAAIRTSDFIRLFADKGFEFIEVAVRRPKSGMPFIAYPDSSSDGYWYAPSATERYARVELSKSGDPNCKELPLMLSYRIDRPPFLPDTCIRITYASSATALYAISLQPAAEPSTKYGKWSIIDRSSGKPVAQLTTVDTPADVAAVRLPESGRVDDCRSPHSMLVSLLAGTAGRHSQVLAVERLGPTVSVEEIKGWASKSSAVSAVEVPVEHTHGEHELLFNPELNKPAWEAVVATARATGWAAFGSWVLDWSKRRMVTLQAKNLYPWQVFAVEGGYFVMPSDDWLTRTDTPIARYGFDGKLLWAVRVAKPAMSECRVFSTQAIQLDGNRLVLASRSCPTPGQSPSNAKLRSKAWSVPLNALPPLAGDR